MVIIIRTASASGVAAVESWSEGHAVAKIRAMVKAKGVHKAKSVDTGYKYVTTNTHWAK